MKEDRDVSKGYLRHVSVGSLWDRKEKAYLTKIKVSFNEIDIVKNPPSREFLEENIDESSFDAFINKHSRNPAEKFKHGDTETLRH